MLEDAGSLGEAPVREGHRARGCQLRRQARRVAGRGSGLGLGAARLLGGGGRLVRREKPSRRTVGESSETTVTRAIATPATINIPSRLTVTSAPATNIETGISPTEPSMSTLMTRPMSAGAMRAWTQVIPWGGRSRGEARRCAMIAARGGSTS